LDSSSEELVLQNLEKTLPVSTLIVISHRLSTLAKFERTLVLRGGRIVRDRDPDSPVAAGLEFISSRQAP
jgi:ABC-type bacteriocin/lantibiotic exporter with double-glycine peptidase domain